MSTKSYWSIVSLIVLFFIIVHFVSEQLHFFSFVNFHDLMMERSISVGLIGICLLTIDVVLPVPSSLIMIANGALFGFFLGTLLSLIGNLGAALTGFFIGRQAEPLLTRFVSSEEQIQVNRFLTEWGLLAVVITRPVPILAEIVVIMAGASEMKWKPMILATFVGSLPITLLYSLAGSAIATFSNTAIILGATLLVAGIFWFLERKLRIIFVISGKFNNE